MTEKKQKSPLGSNPLNQGIYTRTEEESRIQEDDSGYQKADSANQELESRKQNPESRKQQTESRIQKTESRKQQTETSFLKEPVEAGREKVSLTLPPELNDWLDDLVKQGRRHHGQKIPKQIWVQAAIELLQAVPVDWYSINSMDTLREELHKIKSRIQNPENE
jgi:hypothetical protein